MDAKLGMIAGGVLAVLAAPALAQQAPDQTASDGVFKAELYPMNNSGVRGTAYVAKKGEALVVIMEAKGLEPGVEHAQHIHGLADGETAAGCPILADDQDGDNLISLEEGLPVYGDIGLPLEPFPTPTDENPVTFSEAYQLDAETATALQQLESKTIILHGLTVQGTYNATHPVACGEIRPLTPSETQGDGDDVMS